jgi:hypothetical protein
VMALNFLISIKSNIAISNGLSICVAILLFVDNVFL